MIRIFLISILITNVTSDICNFHATLIETEKFYLTQPFSKIISLNFSDYSQAFSKLSDLLPLFSQNLERYGSENKIVETENVKLIPFTSEFNVFAIPNDTLGKDGFKACSLNDGSLVTLTEENRKQLVAILTKLNLPKTTFNTFPFFSLFAPDSKELIETPDLKYIVQLWTKSPPFLHSNNTIEYPNKYKPKGDNSNAEVETSAEDFSSPVICQKPNNPWDLPENRKSWINLASKVKTAISLLQKLKQTYDLSVKSLNSIPQSTWTNAANFFKLVLPEPFQATLSFLETFSKRKNWEKTDRSAADRFYAFTKTALKLVRQFQYGTDSLINLKEENPKFKPITINEMNWRDLFELDEETFGFVGPVTIAPSISYSENSLATNKPVLFKAVVSGRIYNRQLDRISIYDIKPNIIQSQMVTARSLLQTSKFNIISLEAIQPLQCFLPDTEQIKVCHKLPFRIPDSFSTNDFHKCANALLSKNFSSDFIHCPVSSSAHRPSFYRADCDSDGESTLIINSPAPLKLNFVCDGLEKQSKNFTNFPSYVKTECEVQTIENGVAVPALPQFNPDFFQIPTVGSDFSVVVPSIPSNTFPEQLSLYHVMIISVSISVASVLCLVLVGSLIYIICCKRPSCCRKNEPPPPQNNHVLPPFFPAIQLHNYPLLN